LSAVSDSPPAWAKRIERNQTINRGVTAADHAIRSGDRPSGGHQVDLSEGE
jgi:type IV secretion system protein TrbL